jgi:F-type H+-transporting ATPase subunit c
MVLAVLCFAIPAFAADGGTAAANLAPIGAGVGMALAAGLCGLGEGRAVGSACEALARNPGARAAIQTFMIIGLVFIEFLSMMTFVIILMKV